MSRLKEITEFDAIPTIEEVLNFVDCYDKVIEKVCGKTTSTNLTVHNCGHFCAATWICNRNNVIYYDYLVQIFKSHTRMEPGKIVQPHQLSTHFAEENCIQIQMEGYAKTPEGRAIHDALSVRGMPLERDKKYEAAGYQLMLDRFDTYSITYLRERQLDINGHVEEWLADKIDKIDPMTLQGSSDFDLEW